MTDQPLDRGSQPPPDDFDGTLRQSDEAVGKTRDLSVPTGVEQQANAPKIAGYVLTAMLGQGAYAQVWRAWQVRTRKWVAVKCFLARGGVNWMLLQREMERLIRLDKHPHIVSLLDADLTADPAWYALDLLEAGSLEQYVDPAKLAGVDQAAKWMEEIAEALSYVHTKGIIHCDLKPANVLLDDMGHARVADFGQSKVLNESSGALGTLFYMAPEQAMISQGGAGIQPDVRWDVYALGASAYAVLTGKVPNLESLKERLTTSPGLEDRLNAYRELTRGAVLQSAREVRGPVVDEDLSAIVGKCLAYDPDRRYDSMGAVLADLKARRETRPVTPLAADRRYRARRYVRRNRLMVTVGVVAGLALTATVTQVLRKQVQLNAQVADAYVLRGQIAAAEGEESSAALYYAESYRRRKTTVARANALLHLDRVERPAITIAYGGEEITGGARTDDGRFAAYRSGTRKIRAWDVETGKQLGKDLSMPGDIITMSFLPGTRHIAVLTGDQVNVARVWDFERGIALGKPIAPSQDTAAIVADPSGRRLNILCRDKAVRVFDAITGAPAGPVIRVEGGPGRAPDLFYPPGMMISGDGRTLAVTLVPQMQANCVYHVFALPSGRRQARITVPAGRFLSLLSHDGRKLVVKDTAFVVRAWDTRSGRQIGDPMPHPDYARIHVTRDGRRLLSAGNDGVVRVFDLATGRPTGVSINHNALALGVETSPDGKTALSSSWDGTVRIWDIETGVMRAREMRHDHNVGWAWFGPDGRSVVSECDDKLLYVWKPRPLDPPAGTIMDGGSRAMFTPDGRRIVTVGEGGGRIWDPASGRPVSQSLTGALPLGPGDQVSAWETGKDFGILAFGAVVGGVPRLGLVDLATGKPVGPGITSGGRVNAIALSRDGKLVAAGVSGQSVRVWDVRTGRLQGRIMWHDGEVQALAFTADGRRLLAGGADQVLRVWDPLSGTEAVPPTNLDGAVNAIIVNELGTAFIVRTTASLRLWDARRIRPLTKPLSGVWWNGFDTFSPDGRWMVARISLEEIQVWDARTGAQSGKPIKASQFCPFVFSPDGSRMLLVVQANEVRIWDLERRQFVGRQMRHESVCVRGAVSPDGELGAIACLNGTVRLWDARTGSPIGDVLSTGRRPGDVSFSQDGRFLLVVDGAREHRSAVSGHLWDIGWSVDRPRPADLALRTAVKTHRRIDEKGVISVIPREEWRKLERRAAAREVVE